jgi:hypothetical protein
VLVDGAAGLLGWHAWLGLRVARLLGLHVFSLGVLLGRRRAGCKLLGRLLLGVHGLLLLLLLVCCGVGVLVVDGWLLMAGHVGGLGILLLGDCEVLVGSCSSFNGRIEVRQGCGCVAITIKENGSRNLADCVVWAH